MQVSHRDYWLAAGKPIYTASCRGPAVWPDREGDGATLVGVGASVLSPWRPSKPKATHPSKMVQMSPSPSRLPKLASQHTLSVLCSLYSPFFYNSPHLSPLSLCNYGCTDLNKPHLDKILKGRDWPTHSLLPYSTSSGTLKGCSGLKLIAILAWRNCHFGLARAFSGPVDRTALYPRRAFLLGRGDGASGRIRVPVSILNWKPPTAGTGWKGNLWVLA